MWSLQPSSLVMHGGLVTTMGASAFFRSSTHFYPSALTLHRPVSGPGWAGSALLGNPTLSNRARCLAVRGTTVALGTGEQRAQGQEAMRGARRPMLLRKRPWNQAQGRTLGSWPQ